MDTVEPLSDAVLSATHRVSVRLETEAISRRQLLALRDAFEASPGPCTVELRLILEKGEEAILGLSQKITPTDAVLGDMERIFGDTVAELS